MLVLLMSLLSWTQTEGSSCAPIVSIMPNDVTLHVGENFTLMCKFRCLNTEHVAQLWKKNDTKTLLINVTSDYPNVSLALDILSAAESDAGSYSCKTRPPRTISPPLTIGIIDNLKPRGSSQPTITSQLPKCSSCEATSHNGPKTSSLPRAHGLKGQLWYWMLLGKTVILLLLSLVPCVVKKNSQ